MKTRNARLWQWINGGWVKLTLRPNEWLHWGFSCRTDEGWHGEIHAWEHTGDGVASSISTDGCDCDGRLSSARTFYCPLDSLAGNECEDGTRTPNWDRVSACQRDYAAEAAGY